MTSKFMQIHVSNALSDNEDAIAAGIGGAGTSLRAMLEFCTNYRVLGIGAFFLYGDAICFGKYLYKSGRAFLHFLGAADDAVKVTGRSKPFFDAICAVDFDGAREIALRSRRTRSPDYEYEEDFLFVHFLMRRFFEGCPDDEARDLLDRWDKALEGAADERLGVCKALLAKDDEAFDEAIDLFLSAEEARYDDLAESESLTDAILSTEGKLSVEGLAMVRLAERSGMKTRRDYLFIPSLVRPLSPPTWPPDIWTIADP